MSLSELQEEKNNGRRDSNFLHPKEALLVELSEWVIQVRRHRAGQGREPDPHHRGLLQGTKKKVSSLSDTAVQGCGCFRPLWWNAPSLLVAMSVTLNYIRCASQTGGVPRKFKSTGYTWLKFLEHHLYAVINKLKPKLSYQHKQMHCETECRTPNNFMIRKELYV